MCTDGQSEDRAIAALIALAGYDGLYHCLCSTMYDGVGACTNTEAWPKDRWWKDEDCVHLFDGQGQLCRKHRFVPVGKITHSFREANVCPECARHLNFTVDRPAPDGADTINP